MHHKFENKTIFNMFQGAVFILMVHELFTTFDFQRKILAQTDQYDRPTGILAKSVVTENDQFQLQMYLFKALAKQANMLSVYFSQ